MEQLLSTSMIHLWVIGVVTYGLRLLPNNVLNFFKRRYTIEVFITSHDDLYDHFRDWFQEQGLHLMTNLLEAKMDKNTNQKYKLTIGRGSHLIKYKGHKFLVKSVYEQSSGAQRERRYIEIVSFGRNRKPIEDLLVSVSKRKDETKTKIYIYDDEFWENILSRPKRQLDSVYLRPEIKSKILNHFDNFDKSKSWCESKGIPYKTGICFYGPPGTGKSSLSFAIAAYLDRNIYILNLSEMSDRILGNAIRQLPENSVVLIEDIDTYMTTQHRDKRDSSSYSLKLTLSGILQALDGYLAPMGTVIIITTNRLEALDPAIIREGRIDLLLELGNWDECFAKEMALKLAITPRENLPLNPACFVSALKEDQRKT